MDTIQANTSAPQAHQKLTRDYLVSLTVTAVLLALVLGAADHGCHADITPSRVTARCSKRRPG